MRLRTCVSLWVVAFFLAAPVSALAQDALSISVTPSLACATVEFSQVIEGDAGPYTLTWDFGDGDSLVETEVSSPHITTHTYPDQGEYAWSVSAFSPSGLTASASGTLTVPGPEVTLSSSPFPPLLTLEPGGSAQVDFSAEVSGGSEPYQFSWDLDGDGSADEDTDPGSASASFAYTQPGSYTAAVTVSDSCGLSDSDTLPIVILDAATACHPMAQRIADALNTLAPGRTAKAYTCQDIYNFFTGGWTGSQLGFGRMWHAYQLAQVIDEMTWEEILDWHLNKTGWGLLVQLDRIADTLEEVSLTQLVEMVTSGEVSVREIRQAFAVTTRYGADFYDALSRLQDGANPGWLSQFYRTAADMGLEPEALDEYLDQGLDLPEIRRAIRLAEHQDVLVDDILAARLAGDRWGEIRRSIQEHPGRGQGQGMGQQQEQEQVREQERDRLQDRDRSQQHPGRGQGMGQQQEQEQVREQERERIQDRDRDQQQIQNLERLAVRLAERLGVAQEQLRAVFDGSCAQDWSCVMTWLRSQVRQQEHERGRP